MKKRSTKARMTITIPQATLRWLTTIAADGGFECASSLLTEWISQVKKSSTRNPTNDHDLLAVRLSETLDLERLGRSIKSDGGRNKKRRIRTRRSVRSKNDSPEPCDGPWRPISAARMRRILGG